MYFATEVFLPFNYIVFQILMLMAASFIHSTNIFECILYTGFVIDSKTNNNRPELAQDFIKWKVSVNNYSHIARHVRLFPISPKKASYIYAHPSFVLFP